MSSALAREIIFQERDILSNVNSSLIIPQFVNWRFFWRDYVDKSINFWLWWNSGMYIPVDTRRCFNVYKTSVRRRRRLKRRRVSTGIIAPGSFGAQCIRKAPDDSQVETPATCCDGAASTMLIQSLWQLSGWHRKMIIKNCFFTGVKAEFLHESPIEDQSIDGSSKKVTLSDESARANVPQCVWCSK